MIIEFGKHAGKSVETLVLKDADYTTWVLSQDSPVGQLDTVQQEVQRLIAVFDAKPYQKTCSGHGCSRPATRCTVYGPNVYLRMWWCDDCDPYQAGASRGKLFAIRTYGEAIQHCLHFCTQRSAIKDLIKSLAQAKGLPERVGERQAAEFFVS